MVSEKKVLMQIHYIFALVVALSVGAAATAQAVDPSDVDLTKTSRNIHLSGELTPTEGHPYAGFWKTKCSDDSGLAIAPAGRGQYSVSFCGKGGCFKPGTYRPITPLVGDKDYKVESSTRIRVKGIDGNFRPNQRCWPAK
jgi:hypothetical protein